MKTLEQFNFQDKRALVRVDFNVPLNDQQEITDDTRIQAALPTLRKVLNDGGSLVIMSHLGRPKSGPEDKFSLKHIVGHLSKCLNTEVKFASDCISDEGFSQSKDLKPGEVLLLENLRFYPHETGGDLDFSKKLSAHGDIYINDAFGTAHRAHASTAVIAQFFPASKCFGYLMSQEIKAVDKVLSEGKPPVLAILGGAKVSSKITIIKQLLPKVNQIMIGGGMSYTFAKAMGGEIGSSMVENDYLDLAREILAKADELGVEILLPVDSLNADSFSNEANTNVSDVKEIESGWMGLDIGPKTKDIFTEAILKANTILWNGPMGVFEMETFNKGTLTIAEAIAKSTANGAFSLVGGGDSVAAVKKFGYQDKVSYVSTGGGAMLEYLEGKELPGIAAINKA